MPINSLPDTLAGVLIRVKNLTENKYYQNAVVKINDTTLNYNPNAFGYVDTVSYFKSKNYKIDINFENYSLSLNCVAPNLDSVKIFIDSQIVKKGSPVNVFWYYGGSPSGSNMILLQKQGSIDFYYGTGYIPISQTSYVLNTSNLESSIYYLWFISGNFCSISDLDSYPNFPSSLIFVGVLTIRSIEVQ
jgi:hypothetical protein